MALFKILKGPEKKNALGNSVMLSGTNGAPPLHEGWAYVTDEGNLYVDLSDKKRVKINQNADYAIVAEYDIKNQPIISTYIKNATLNTSATKPTYTFTRGDNTTFSVNIPIASATLAGIITTGSQTLTGAKTLDANGSLIIQGTNGLTYSGIESASGDSYRPVWFSRNDKNGTPVYNTNFTYNPNTATLKVAHLDGLAAKATADGNGDNIRSTYVKSLGLTTNKYGITYQKGDGTETTISPNLAASDSNGGTALTAAQLVSYDTRGVNPAPQDLDKGIHLDFKSNTTDNLKDGGSYHGTLNWRSYGSSTDLTGGYPIEIAYTANGNLWTRIGTSATTWGSWKRLVYSDGTIANATKATQDSSGQVITATYIKNMALVNSATQPTYTLTRGDNTTFSVNVPIASATNAGSITTGTQTITGAKTINANGSLTIAKSGGFIYSGIETAGDTTDGDRQVWVAHGSIKGIPVLSGANFTYNSKTKTLKVSHIIGEITKAISDTLNQQIDKTYIKNITLTGHATQPYLVLTKGDNTTSNLNLPIASTTAAGLITNAAQTIAGDKTFTGQILKKGVSSSWIGGRTNALVRMTEIHGYSPFASIKTTNGSWEIGAYDNSSYTDDLVFSYCTDANFNAGSNSTSAQIKFLENGHIVAALDGRATQALQDSQGQQINTTYLKNIALVNHATLPKYTITKGDGNTFDVNLPVANESNAGVITNTTQALAGNKSLKGSLSTTENITTAKQLISNIATGTSPLKVTSTTVVTNLNADTVDGMHASNNSFTQANASDTTLPTQLAIWNSLNSLLISAQALVYRGTLTPAQFKALSASGVNRGDVFVVSAEGSFGGKYCEPGDMLICYDKTSTAVTWDIVQTNIDGSVVIKGGGAAATVHADVHAIARFDSNTGRVIDNSKVFIDDNGHMTAKATETQDIGTSDNKWRTIYAKSFNGLATNATADSSGQNIMDTYIKDWTLTKHATQPFVTLTKGNGNTSDINLPIAGQNDAGLITNAAQTIYGVKTFNTSIIAKSDHDFISHSNEFNVIPKLSANIAFNFNYRQKDGNGAGKITQYNFCNGAGGILASISQGQFSGNAATATKATQDSTGQQINTTYIKSVRLVSGTNPSYEFTRGDNTTFSVNVPISDLDGHYVKKTGDTMTGNLTVPSIYASNWFRSTGTTGWYNETYGGGWYMTDSTYIRNYAGKSVRLDNLCLGADNNSYRLYVNGTSYFNGQVTATQFNGPLNGNATSATKLVYGPILNSDAAINSFHAANTFQAAVWTETSFPGVSNGIILDMGYASDTYGAQIAIDDDPTYFMALRQKGSDGWNAWKRIPMGDGTGASGTWGISINGNAATSTISRSLGSDDTMKVYGQYNNEVNFGGTNNSSTIYFGYRAVDSKPIPSQFIFGGTNGTAAIVAGGATFNGCVYTNRGSTAAASFKWNKSGTYWGGIGYNGVNNENYFGPCDANGNWVAMDNCGAERWRFAGQIIIQSPTTDSVAYGATNPTITFMNVNKSQNVSLIYTDYDSVRAPAGIKLIGNQGNEWFQAPRVFGAVWNDYAEYRSTSEVQPGQCVVETGFGDLIQSTERLQPGANIVSDTFGFAIGETEKTKTPLAVSGRVLAYPYEDRYSYSAGDPVCSGPNGTISKMTREEVREYPDRIVGTVSEIPEYEVWGTGKVKVNRRIWIRVR